MENHRILAEHQFRNNNTWESGLNNNDVIIGPSGAGKTRYYVKPNLLQCNESIIVADTKGSLYRQVGSVMEKEGYRVITVDFKNLEDSYGYNPFDFIRYIEKDDRYSEQDIMTIATALCPVLTDRDPFWENAAKMYVSCFIAYTLENLPKEEHNLLTIHKLINVFTDNATIFDNMMTEHKKNCPNSFAVKQYSLFSANTKAEKMHQSILGILAERLSPLVYSEVSRLYTVKKRINFKHLSLEKTVVFLTVSDTDRSMDRLVNLFYTQALQTLCNYADSTYRGRLQIPVRIIFDDFATNTLIPDFDNIISVIRSREIYVSIILQSITQLQGLYGDAKAQTIINNCDNCLYLGGQDVGTAEYIAIKSNRSIQSVLHLPLSEALLFTRGQEGQTVAKYNLEAHPLYPQLPEARLKRQYEQITTLQQELETTEGDAFDGRT